MYTDSFFYNPILVVESNTYEIDKFDIQSIQSLKSHISDRGSYDHMLRWRLSDNDHLSEKELNQLYPAMQLIAMSGRIKSEFISKYDVKDYHISLLRRLYLDWDGWNSGGEECITMGLKRPFGNSNVLGDVRQEMIRYGDKLALDRYNNGDLDYSVEESVLSEFVKILDKFFQEGFDLIVSSFIKNIEDSSFKNKSDSDDPWFPFFDKKFRMHHYLYRWSPDISAIRDMKIETLIKN